MVKWTATFDIGHPEHGREEEERFFVAAKAMNLYLALWTFDQYLRGIQRRDTPFKGTEEVDKIRDRLWEIMDEYKLDFDMAS